MEFVFININKSWEWGCLRSAKKISGTVDGCEGGVISVIKRAQALVYDVLADSIIRSLEY